MASSQPTAIVVDRAPHTTTPDWVHVSKVSVGAKMVYVLLTVFAETYAGQHRDEPVSAQSMLAEVLDMSQPWISARVKELREIGAIEHEPDRRPGAGGGYIYRIRKNPPEGYVGPTTLVERMAERTPRTKRRRDAAPTNTNGAPTNVAPSAPTNAVATNAANVGGVRSDQRRTNVAPANAANGAPTNAATFAPTVSATQTANAADDHPLLPVLARLIDAAAEAGMGTGPRGDVSFHRKLGPRLLPMLEGGWREDELRELITENLGTAGKIIAVVLSRLEDAATQRRRVPRQAPRQGPRCDKGLGHDQWPADACQECAINARDEARNLARHG